MRQELIIGKYTLESLTNGMYASPFDMYREYIQNAVDSFDEVVNKGIEHADKLRIDISINQESNSVIIRDNGLGIRSDSAVSTLLDIGNSHKSNLSARGFRGIGRLAGLSYCEKLTFRTSYRGEEICTIIEFDAKHLKDLLLPDTSESVTVEDVINQIVTIRIEKETSYRRYFEVELNGIWNETGITDVDGVREYLVQHAPLYFSDKFKWGRTVEEKIRLKGYMIPQYHIFLNNVELFKPYQDSFLSDRVKRSIDLIQDVIVEAFYRGDTLSAVLWYGKTSYFGTIIDNMLKGIRIRQGNILIGDKGSCSPLFKEERFNGWMIGELYVLDKDIIANSRRDGFEKNVAYFELIKQLKDWANDVSKEIRHISYERNLTSTKKAIAEANGIDELNDENGLCSEDLGFGEDYNERSFFDTSESGELAETDYISKLSQLIYQKKSQTKYTAININAKLTMEQRKTLERVFDLIKQAVPPDIAETLILTISSKF